MDNPNLAMDNKSSLVFSNYRFNKIFYQENPNFVFNAPIDIEFSLGAQIDIINSDEKESQITLSCEVFEEAEKNNFPFYMELSISGNFTFDGDITDQGFFEFCKTSGIAVLLPYLRAAASNITSTANTSPLVLPLINVKSFVDALKTNTQ